MELKIDHKIVLPASKSESNRALIIQALAYHQTGTIITLHNLSEAADTVILKNIVDFLAIEKNNLELNAEDAGTAYRFLTAYLAITNQKCLLTGSARMQERPIGILVEALRTLGADIAYVGKEGYPPLQINGFKQLAYQINVQADVSSQYISALLLIAPLLPMGLALHLVGKISSKPYIEMTIQQMTHFGIVIKADWEAQTFYIAPQNYQQASYTIESDWSAASYWYSAMALLTPDFCTNVRELRRGKVVGKMNLLLKGLRADSLQGDKCLVNLMPYWSVQSKFTNEGVVLNNQSPILPPNYHLDFLNCPDLAQTIITLIANYIPAMGPWQVRYPHPPLPWSVQYPAPTKARLAKSWSFSGLESLRIKETDRIIALKNELAKLGTEFYLKKTTAQGEIWGLKKIEGFVLEEPVSIKTYRDHRMAMSFAPLALIQKIIVQNPEVVQKSYPNFWQEWGKFQVCVKEKKLIKIRATNSKIIL